MPCSLLPHICAVFSTLGMMLEFCQIVSDLLISSLAEGILVYWIEH